MANMDNITLCNDSFPNVTCEAEFPRTFGPRAVDVGTVIMAAVFGLICVVGLVGNGLVIFVIVRYTKMKTVTNMYILNLSIADSVFLLGLPLVMTTAILQHWIFGYAMCKIYFILTCINTFEGALTLLTMSGDRYLAVCFPITSMRYRTSAYARIAIAITWMVSLLLMIPIVLYAKNMEHPYFSGIFSCKIVWPSTRLVAPEKAFIYYNMLLGFVIPVLLISLLYTLLIVRLKTTGPQVKSAEKKRSHRKVTKLVTLIIGVYIICWLPYWAFQVHLINHPHSVRQSPWLIDLFKFFTVLSYANSMMNPCLYAFTNDNFRDSFINAFRCAADASFNARRGSELNSTVGNNNFAGNKGKKQKNSNEYEFTTLNNTAGVLPDAAENNLNHENHDNIALEATSEA